MYLNMVDKSGLEKPKMHHWASKALGKHTQASDMPAALHFGKNLMLYKLPGEINNAINMCLQNTFVLLQRLVS